MWCEGPPSRKERQALNPQGRFFPHEVWLPYLFPPVARPVPPIRGRGRVLRSLLAPQAGDDLPALVTPACPASFAQDTPLLSPLITDGPAIGPGGGAAVHRGRFGPVSGGTPIDCPASAGNEGGPELGLIPGGMLARRGRLLQSVEGSFRPASCRATQAWVARDGCRGGLGGVPTRMIARPA